MWHALIELHVMIQNLWDWLFTKALHSLMHIFHIVQYGDNDLSRPRRSALSEFRLVCVLLLFCVCFICFFPQHFPLHPSAYIFHDKLSRHVMVVVLLLFFRYITDLTVLLVPLTWTSDTAGRQVNKLNAWVLFLGIILVHLASYRYILAAWLCFL